MLFSSHWRIHNFLLFFPQLFSFFRELAEKERKKKRERKNENEERIPFDGSESSTKVCVLFSDGAPFFPPPLYPGFSSLSLSLTIELTTSCSRFHEREREERKNEREREREKRQRKENPTIIKLCYLRVYYSIFSFSSFLSFFLPPLPLSLLLFLFLFPMPSSK